jgi:cell division protein FtsI (penicillin-binding protein 3)
MTTTRRGSSGRRSTTPAQRRSTRPAERRGGSARDPSRASRPDVGQAGGNGADGRVTSKAGSAKARARTTRPPTKKAAGRSSAPAKARRSAPKTATSRRRSGKAGWRSAGDPRRRAIGLLAALVILFAVLAGRLVMVQVLMADRYVAYGESQRVQGIELAAGRGAIFDRNDQELAVSIPRRTVVADPRLVTDPQRTAEILAVHLGVDVETIRQRLTSQSAFEYIARQIPDEVADAIEAEDLDGVWFEEEPTRVNPADDLARSLLGRVGVDNTGLSGLEQQYDEALTGTPGELVLERDPDGRTIPAGRHHREPAEPGEDLVLTVDRGLQFEAERILSQQVQATGALGGTAIISNPETGEILALVNVETDQQTGTVADRGNNLAVTATYEPGSVNKVVTMAAAIEEGLVTPETTFEVPDTLQVADHEFSDSHSHPTQTLTVSDILTESSNVGTIKVAQQLGEEALYDYLRDFGFGEPTALDFPSEVAGGLPEPDEWSGTSIGTIPIGQGISVSAMQMLYAYNTIANDGVYVSPRLVGSIVDAEGERRPGPEGPSRRVVSAETAATMRDMMTRVVSEGTGELAAIEGYEVAGKTGTARKPQEGGGYEDAAGNYHYIATFAGFLPADDPKLSVIVTLDEPEGMFASSTAAPAFAELSRYALRQMRIPPTMSDVSTPEITLTPPRERAQPAPASPTTTTTAPSTTTSTPPPSGGTGGANGVRRPAQLHERD